MLSTPPPSRSQVFSTFPSSGLRSHSARRRRCHNLTFALEYCSPADWCAHSSYIPHYRPGSEAWQRKLSHAAGGGAHTADALFSSPSVTCPTALVNQPLAIGSEVAILTGVPEKNVFFQAMPKLPPPLTPIWASWSTFLNAKKYQTDNAQMKRGFLKKLLRTLKTLAFLK